MLMVANERPPPTAPPVPVNDPLFALARDQLPDEAPFFEVAQIKAVLGPRWSLRRTRRWLHRAGVLERRHGVLVTTAERLHAEFPEIYQRLIGADE
jgi:hypothetical protein